MTYPRTSRSLKFTLAATPEQVFPLLCPVREYEWIESWACELVYSESGVAEDNCIFLTTRDDGLVDTWVVSRYEPPRRIDFVVTNAMFACRTSLALHGTAGGKTRLDWDFTLTGLGRMTPAALEHSANQRVNVLHEREQELSHYLATGQLLKHGQVRKPFAHPPTVSTKDISSVFLQAGADEALMRRFHAAFERHDSAKHTRFLQWLGCSPEQVETIRQLQAD